MARIVFRCDGGQEIGIGHVKRCESIATALLSEGHEARFAVTNRAAAALTSLPSSIVAPGAGGACDTMAVMRALQATCLVVDQYGLGQAFERRIREVGAAIAVIDDLADRPHDCDVLFDSGPLRTADDYRPLVPAHARLCLGEDYILLRPEFSERRSRKRMRQGKPCRLVGMLGGADPLNLSSELLGALHLAGQSGLSTTFIVGPLNPRGPALRDRANELGIELLVDPPNLADLMADADLAITAGGVSAWEFACLGVPAVVIVLAENQRGIASALARAGAAIMLECDDVRGPSHLAMAVDSMVRDPQMLSRMSIAGRRLVDGRGAARVASIIVQLAEANSTKGLP